MTDPKNNLNVMPSPSPPGTAYGRARILPDIL